MEKIIQVKNAFKTYKSGYTAVNALSGISFDVFAGELVVILGPSGSGKTTLLNLLGGMDVATSGEIWVNNKNLCTFSKKELTLYRRNDIGFVFQFYNLMSNLTALENIELASELCKTAMPSKQALEMVQLADKQKHFPSQLSGGEQQRVSIARAIAKNAEILLCDEPTGALDYKTGKVILQLLQDVCKTQNKTVLIVTHNAALKDMADRVIYIKNGNVEKLTINKEPKPISEIEW